VKELVIALRLFVVLTIVTGVIYPLAATGLAQSMFREKANGSLIERDGKVVGSKLIGQSFTDPKYFSSRPSATGPFPYNAAASSGSNLGPTNPALIDGITARKEAFLKDNPGKPVPTELVTASASGLDPHISPQAAEVQIDRIAKLRSMSISELKELVEAHTQMPALGILGEPVVNVLELNLALDARP